MEDNLRLLIFLISILILFIAQASDGPKDLLAGVKAKWTVTSPLFEESPGLGLIVPKSRLQVQAVHCV